MHSEFDGTNLDSGVNGAWFNEFGPEYCTNCDICGENLSPKQLRTITLEDVYPHGKITVNKYFAYEGDNIQVTVVADQGYELEEGSLKYNNTLITGNSFVMPDENVTIHASFVKFKVPLPETDMIVKAKAANKEATSYFEAKYENSGILFKITTLDEEIISTSTDLDKNDGIELLVNKTSETKGLEKEQTVYFRATAGGYYEVYKAVTTNSFTKNFDPTILIFPGINFYTNAYLTSIDNMSAYVINVYISYDLMGTTFKEGYHNITMCPGLVNANTGETKIELGQKGYSYKCYWKNCKTFALINDDNKFTQRATGTDEDILDPTLKPEGYIYGANFVGRCHWSFARLKLAQSVSLENVESVMVEIRFNEANPGDWFRVAAISEDGTFFDAFGKDSATSFKYSCSEYIKETADYNWETGQWGGWDPSWSGPTPPTYYVEVPVEYIFARFNVNGTMIHQVGSSMKEHLNLSLSQIGVYMTADSNYNFSIGCTYVRRNGVVEKVSDPVNLSREKQEGKDIAACSKIDSNGEGASTVEINSYPKILY